MLKKGESIKLQEGYELFLKGINSDGQIYLELQKDGKLVDESFLAPSAYGQRFMIKYIATALMSARKRAWLP